MIVGRNETYLDLTSELGHIDNHHAKILHQCILHCGGKKKAQALVVEAACYKANKSFVRSASKMSRHARRKVNMSGEKRTGAEATKISLPHKT